MEYTPRELAEIVGFTRRQVYRVYRKIDGFPHRVDDTKHVWINGAEFRKWYKETYKSITLAINETYCLTCNAAVKIIDPIKHEHHIESLCPNCGRTLAKLFGRSKE